MGKNIKNPAVDYLFDAILSLKDKDECYAFFDDICTVNEILSLSQRFEVAAMLRSRKTYLEIAEKTGASTATISRVNRSLNYGNLGMTWYSDESTHCLQIITNQKTNNRKSQVASPEIFCFFYFFSSFGSKRSIKFSSIRRSNICRFM